MLKKVQSFILKQDITKRFPFISIRPLNYRQFWERKSSDIQNIWLVNIYWHIVAVGTQNFTQLQVVLIFTSFSLESHICPDAISRFFLFFFIYNLNQQSEFKFYKLMLWLLQCLDGESSPVPQIRSIGQFLLSRLFSSLVLRSGFSWVPILAWCFVAFLVDDLLYVWYA
jgi:hypothetical protein